MAFFNNKGGVGKTTLACNFAASQASAGRRVLIVDLDPQCNSTQLVLSDDQWSAIYEDTAESDSKTVMALLRRIRAGDSDVDVRAFHVEQSKRFKADVLPGHPSLSIFEDILSESWSDLRGGRPGGARRTTWLLTLREALRSKYDLIVVDVSPSLGAINRSALVGSDYYVTPMSADLFSLYALDNISVWFDRWLREYDTGRAACEEELRATGYGDLLPDPLPIRHGFLGYTVQQYVSRASGGEIRRVQAYDSHRNEIPSRAKRLIALSKFSAGLELGTVPNMFSMVPLAQSRHAPIAALRKSDGLRGAQFSQQTKYADQLADIFAKITRRLATGQAKAPEQ